MTCPKVITAAQLQRDKKRYVASSRRWTVTGWVGERRLGVVSATGAEARAAARGAARAFASTLSDGALLRLVVLPDGAEGVAAEEFGATVQGGVAGELRCWAGLAQTDLEHLLGGQR